MGNPEKKTPRTQPKSTATQKPVQNSRVQLKRAAENAAKKLANAPSKSPQTKVQKKYLTASSRIDKTTVAEYKRKLVGMEISAIRGNPQILVKNKGNESAKQRILNRRAEMTKRLAIYTTPSGGGWFKLNYPPKHEYPIGLGEIALCAKFVKIKKPGENPIIAEMKIVPPGQKHSGRWGPVDKDGQYVATFSDDYFQIIDKSEVDVNNFRAATAYVKQMDATDKLREKHGRAYKRDSESQDYDFNPYTSPYDTSTFNKHVNGRSSILPQIRKRLSQHQRDMVKVIEREFKAVRTKDFPNGLPNSLIAAAVVNSYSESGLRARQQSTCKIRYPGRNEGSYNGREDSWGLFQVNVSTIRIKRGMTEAQKAEVRAKRAKLRIAMQDPVKNCRKVLSWIMGYRGKRLLAAAKAGASVPKLTALFTVDIERPSKRRLRGRQRAIMAMKFFNLLEKKGSTLKRRRTPHEEISSKGGVITGRFAGPPWGKKRPTVRWRPNGKINIRPRQKKWVFGSSTISGSCQRFLGGGVGRVLGHIGIGAYHAGRMLNFLIKKSKENKGHWKDLFDQAPPSKIVLAGFALNDIGRSGSSDATIVNRSIKRHKALKKFFEAWGKAKGVKVKVLIATNQEHTGKGPIAQRRIAMFNQRLRNEGLTHDSVDLAKKMKENGWKTSNIDNLHLSVAAAKGFVDMLVKA